LRTLDEVNRLVTNLGLRIKQSDKFEREQYLKCHEMLSFLTSKLGPHAEKAHFSHTELTIYQMEDELENLFDELKETKKQTGGELSQNISKADACLSKIVQQYLSDKAKASSNNALALTGNALSETIKHDQYVKATSASSVATIREEPPVIRVVTARQSNHPVVNVKIKSSGNLVQSGPLIATGITSPMSVQRSSNTLYKKPEHSVDELTRKTSDRQSLQTDGLAHNDAQPQTRLFRPDTAIEAQSKLFEKRLEKQPILVDSTSSVKKTNDQAEQKPRIIIKSGSSNGLQMDIKNWTMSNEENKEKEELTYGEIPYETVLQRKGLDLNNLEVF
jgi:hypothetical protein